MFRPNDRYLELDGLSAQAERERISLLLHRSVARFDIDRWTLRQTLKRLGDTQLHMAWEQAGRRAQARRRSIAGRLWAAAIRVRHPDVGRAVRTIAASGLFHDGWYLHVNPSVDDAGLDPIVHYVVTGWREHRDPSPQFSTSWYLQTNPDVARAGLNPLQHYIERGADEGRAPHPPLAIEQSAFPRESENASSGAADGDYPPALRDLLETLYADHETGPFRECYGLLRAGVQFGGAHLTNRIAEPAMHIKPSRIDASIIVPLTAQWDDTLRCLLGILAQPAKAKFEIVVAGHTDASAAAVDSIVRSDLIRYSRVAAGSAAAFCNAAAQTARGDVVVFLSYDALVLPRWLDELVAAMHSDASIGLVASKVVDADGILLEAGGITGRGAELCRYGQRDDATAPEANYLKDMDWASWSSVAVRRSTWDAVGGFDARSGAPEITSSQAADLAFRVRAHGQRTVYQPLSTVLIDRETPAPVDDAGAAFAERWQDVLDREHLPLDEHTPVARDRSRHRPHLLVIDQYIPRPERDAGSRSIFHYVRLFQASGFQVHFWPHDRRYDRANAQALQRLGVEVLYDRGWQEPLETWLKAYGPYIDYVLLSRPAIAAAWIDAVRRETRAKVLFFGIDIESRRLALEYAVTGNPEIERQRAVSAALELDAWGKCDVQCYYSDEERDTILATVPTARVSVVPLYAYTHEELRRIGERIGGRKPPAGRDVLFVGGFRHNPNVDGVSWFIRNVWGRIKSAVPDARLRIVGVDPPWEIASAASDSVLVTGAVSDDALAGFYEMSRVAIVRLRYGAGVKGKLIEALSFGVPVVTTSIGMQGMPDASRFVDVCDSAADFAEAVVAKLIDHELARNLVRAGLDYLTSTYSQEAARAQLIPELPELETKRP